MQIPKPTEEDKAYFRSVVPVAAGVEVKAMFGNLGAFVNGNMFMGLFGASVGVRLPPEAREELLGTDGAGPFGPDERPMGEYVAMPMSWRSDPDSTELWVSRAFTHVAAMPPKRRK